MTAVGALWLDGSFWFQTGSGTREGRNVARDPRCSIVVSIRDADFVADGAAARETDPATLARLAKAWADQGWPAEVDETGAGITAPFNAPSQGPMFAGPPCQVHDLAAPPPWNVYRVRPHSVTVARAETLDAAYIVNRGRFRHRRPSPPRLGPAVAWINADDRERRSEGG